LGVSLLTKKGPHARAIKGPGGLAEVFDRLCSEGCQGATSSFGSGKKRRLVEDQNRHNSSNPKIFLPGGDLNKEDFGKGTKVAVGPREKVGIPSKGHGRESPLEALSNE